MCCEIDNNVARTRVDTHNVKSAAAAQKRIGVIVINESVAARATSQTVSTQTTGDGIVAVTAVNCVVVISTVQCVVKLTAENSIVAIGTVKD